MKTQWFNYSPDPDNKNSGATSDVSSNDSANTSSNTSDDTSNTDESNTGNSSDTNTDSSEASAADDTANDDPSNADDQASSGGASSASGITSTEFLFVDVSPWEANPGWQALLNTSNFYGGILKASQGIKGYLNDRGWFQRNWPLVKSVAGDRYGSTWFRGAYVFLNLWQDGAAQADYYLEIINDAGGWDSGDMIPIVDVELGNDGSNGKPRNRNQDVPRQQIIDCTSVCAERLKEVTGRSVMLYGRGAMRDKGINSKMGCDIVWNPCYTSTIVMHGLEAWTLDDVVLWQYCGDGQAALADQNKFPRSIPNFGNTDISVYVEGKNKPSFDKLKERLGIGS